jgi:hypothetical protein
MISVAGDFAPINTAISSMLGIAKGYGDEDSLKKIRGRVDYDIQTHFGLNADKQAASRGSSIAHVYKANDIWGDYILGTAGQKSDRLWTVLKTHSGSTSSFYEIVILQNNSVHPIHKEMEASAKAKGVSLRRHIFRNTVDHYENKYKKFQYKPGSTNAVGSGPAPRYLAFWAKNQVQFRKSVTRDNPYFKNFERFVALYLRTYYGPKGKVLLSVSIPEKDFANIIINMDRKLVKRPPTYGAFLRIPGLHITDGSMPFILFGTNNTAIKESKKATSAAIVKNMRKARSEMVPAPKIA